MQTKLEQATKEIEILNRQLQEKDKTIEQLNQSQYVHNFKYGVLINQNEELTERLKQKDEIIGLL